MPRFKAMPKVVTTLTRFRAIVLTGKGCEQTIIYEAAGPSFCRAVITIDQQTPTAEIGQNQELSGGARAQRAKAPVKRTSLSCLAERAQKGPEPKSGPNLLLNDG